MKSLIFGLMLMALNAFGLEGKVISFADGDTLTVLTSDKQQVKIRLSGIDTPEKNQAYGHHKNNKLVKPDICFR